jgi:hypothetical protein
MSIEFAVKKQVVCIEGPERLPFENEIQPVIDGVYTIRRIKIHHSENRCSFLLEEIVNEQRQYTDGFGEVSFFSTRFKPVKPTNIDVFTKLLNPTPVKEKEYV